MLVVGTEKREMAAMRTSVTTMQILGRLVAECRQLLMMVVYLVFSAPPLLSHNYDSCFPIIMIGAYSSRYFKQ